MRSCSSVGTWMVKLPRNLDEMVRVALDQLRGNRAAAADRVGRAMEGAGDAIGHTEAGEAAMQELHDRLTRTIDHDPRPDPQLR